MSGPREARARVRLAHVADLHLGAADPDEEDACLRALFAACARTRVDHVVVTGDLSEHGDPRRTAAFEAAARAGGFGPERLTIVRGNHDLRARRVPASFWAPAAVPRRIGCVRLVPLDSTAHNGLAGILDAHAMGLLGEAQLDALDRVLAEPLPGVADVLALHHHVNASPAGSAVEMVGRLISMWGPLEDRRALLDLCARRRVPVLLTGHDHTPRVYRVRRRGHVIRCFIAGPTLALGRFRMLELAGGTLVRWGWVTLRAADADAG